jgi:predicted phage tail protein
VLAVPAAASASGKVEDGRISLSWDRLANARRYEFQLARDEEFGDLVVTETVETLSHTVEGLEAGEYHYRARGVSGEGVAGPYSPVNALEIPGEPVSPAWLLLLAPLLLLL